jgi:hypothetical protein
LFTSITQGFRQSLFKQVTKKLQQKKKNKKKKKKKRRRNKLKYRKNSSIGGGKEITMRVEHKSTRVGHALIRGGNVATRRAATSGGDARRWLGKPKKNKSNLDQTGSKTLKAKEQSKTRRLDGATSRRGERGGVTAAETNDEDQKQETKQNKFIML